MSKEYPCVYYEKKLCKKFSKNGFTSFCAMGPCPHKTPSNADRIRAMSDAELAGFMLDENESSFNYCVNCDHYSNYAPHCCAGNIRGGCIAARVKWLRQPAEEDSNG